MGMVCRISELQYKEIVDITDGTRYGFLSDVEVDGERGTVEALVVSGQRRLLGLLGREPDVAFPWSAVKRVGADIILVDGGRRLAAGASGKG